MEGLKAIPYVALIIAVSGIIIGASALVLSSFANTTTDADALSAISNASLAIQTVGEQLPTVAIIAIMVVIISVIASVFLYFRYFS